MHEEKSIFVQQLLPDPTQLRLESWELDAATHELCLSVTSTQPTAVCPLCQESSRRVHSRYCRTLQDLPCASFALRLELGVRKFFCRTPGCKRRIFTERLPQVAAPWARRTHRLVQHLIAIAVALGGRAGSRLGHRLGYLIADSSLLSLLATVSLPAIAPPTVLGVDDFAFCPAQRSRSQHACPMAGAASGHRSPIP